MKGSLRGRYPNGIVWAATIYWTLPAPSGICTARCAYPAGVFPPNPPHSKESRMRLARFTRLFSRALIAGAMCLVATTAWAQGTVTGRVTAQDSNQPLSDARVLAVGTNAAATTAQDGRYTLRGVRSGEIELQV